MKKTAKIILTIICSLIILVVMLPIVLSMLLQIGFVQKFAIDKTTEILSNLTGTTFSISRVEIGFFNKAYFEDVYVESPTGDTMIYVQKVDAAVNGINFFTGKIALGNVTLSDAKVYLYKDSTGMMNVQTVFDHFKPKVPNPNPPNFRMSCTQVNLVDACLKLDDFTSQEQPWGVNFKNMELQRINFQATNVEIFNYDVRLAITHLSLREKCGFKLQHASSTKCGVNVTGMRFENFRIETPQSILRMPHFNLLYDSWYDYNNFVNEVTLDAELSNSRVSIATINYFMKKKLPINTVVEIDARVVGIIPRLSGQIESAEVEGSHFSGDFVITGLPDITQTNFAFSLPNLTTSSNSIGRIVTQITGKPLSADLMAILERNNEIHLSGQFDGLLSDFTANCLLTTALGSATAALRVNPRHAGGVGFVGSVHTQDYALGKALDSKKLGGLSLDASVDALLNQQGDIELKTAATINSLQWNGYRYNQIEMNGKLGKSIFDGSLSSTDSNFNCTAHGLFDFSLSEPHYDFTMSLKNANLGQLNINKRDSISLLAAQATINLSGGNIDNLNGWATIDSIHYINHIDTVETGAIYITSENTETKKLITLNSDFADIELRGRNSYANMFGYLTKMAATYIPSIPDATEIVTGTKTDVIKQAEAEQTFSDGYYILKVNVKQANNVAAIFVPGLEIARGSKIDFFFNPHLNKFNFDLHSDYILTNDLIIDSLDINSRNQGDSLSLFMTIDQMQVGKIYLPNLSALAGIKDNRIALSMRFEADDHSSGALISTLTDIYRTKEGTPQLDMQIFPGTITLNKERWRLSSDGVVIDTSGIVIKKFGLNSNSQNLSIDGKIGRAASDTLRLGIKNLNLSPLSVFVDDLGYSIKGDANGQIKAMSILNDLSFYATLDFNDIYFGGYSLGNSAVRSTIDRQNQRIDFTLLLPDGTRPATGYYDIANRRYNARALFPKFNLQLLEPLYKGILQQSKGEAAVDLTISGGKNTPTLNGTVDIKSYSVNVDYTKVRYNVAGGRVTVRNNRFTLPQTPVTDIYGHGGKIEAFFDSKYFNDLSFGVDVRFSDMLCINTTAKDNELFYGKAFGTGLFNVNGTDRNTNINIVAQTALNSNFVMPFSSVATISDANFITFTDSKAKETINAQTSHRTFVLGPKKRDTYTSELDIKIDLKVLPNTEAKILYDNSAMSNIIQARGTGRLLMHINPSQELFTINGPVEIERGSYRFTVSIFDKWFTLQQGGRLTWSGSPADPDVDFKGIYKVKASLDPIIGSMGASSGSGTVPIECGITLTGKLFNPNIALSIDAPTATPETQSILRNAMNTEEQTTMQFLSLFASGTFMPDTGTAGIGTMSGSLAGATGFEFLSNQISNLISSDKYNIRFGYKPKTEMNSDEFNVDFTTDIVQGKLSLELAGTYNTGNTPSANTRSPFTGDAYVTLSLNKANTLKLKGYTRTIDRFDETQGLQESGVGVYFRQDFQNLADLRRRYKLYLQKIKEQRETNKEKKAIKNNQKK